MEKKIGEGNIVLKEGYILDRATKRQLDGRKPEEVVRQEYEKIRTCSIIWWFDIFMR